MVHNIILLTVINYHQLPENKQIRKLQLFEVSQMTFFKCYPMLCCYYIYNIVYTSRTIPQDISMLLIDTDVGMTNPAYSTENTNI